MNYIGLIIVALIAEAKSIDLPSNFKICHLNTPNFAECVSSAVTEAVVSMAQGLKSFNILPLEPLEVDTVSIGENGGPVSLKQIYKNVKLHGLTKSLKIKYSPFDLDNLILRSTCYNDQVDFVADYTMTGKVLLLPIRGNGKSNVTMLNLKSDHNIHYEKYEKNGETYLRVTKYEIKFIPKKVLLNFTNLIDGDPTLSEQMNKFVNANWQIVFDETKEAYAEAFGLVFVNVANKIFSRVPVNKIFPE